MERAECLTFSFLKITMATEINTTTPLMTFISLLSTGTCLAFGHLISTYQNIHLPPIIIETLQCLSYGGAFTISCITAYKFYKEVKKKKKS